MTSLSGLALSAGYETVLNLQNILGSPILSKPQPKVDTLVVHIKGFTSMYSDQDLDMLQPTYGVLYNGNIYRKIPYSP